MDIKTAGLSLKKREGQARVIKNQISEMEFAHRVDGSVNGQTIWNSFLSPHRIWKVNGKASELTLNGVTMGFQVENGKLDGKMTLSDVYRGGLLLSFSNNCWCFYFFTCISDVLNKFIQTVRL